MIVLNYILLFVFSYIINCVNSHGYLALPGGRSSLWRYNKQSPINYDDNALNCGGFDTQHSTNKGKCGICGDNYSSQTPRPNEDGGKFGNGIIAANYTVGGVINTIIKITANHKGNFTFSLCNLDAQKNGETEECFEHIQLANGHDTFEVKSARTGNFPIALRLPANVKCSRCVLRWHWVAGNNWGLCPDGHYAVGCGPQEEFVNCADISVL